jgi:hypothetical protein
MSALRNIKKRFAVTEDHLWHLLLAIVVSAAWIAALSAWAGLI